MNTTNTTDAFLRRREKLLRGITFGDGRAADRLDALIIEMRRTLGPDHPDTLETELAYLELQWGAAGERVLILHSAGDTAARAAKVFGPDSPQTHRARWLATLEAFHQLFDDLDGDWDEEDTQWQREAIERARQALRHVPAAVAGIAAAKGLPPERAERLGKVAHRCLAGLLDGDPARAAGVLDRLEDLDDAGQPVGWLTGALGSLLGTVASHWTVTVRQACVEVLDTAARTWRNRKARAWAKQHREAIALARSVADGLAEPTGRGADLVENAWWAAGLGVEQRGCLVIPRQVIRGERPDRPIVMP